jgi:hypothetical protein
MQCFLHWERTDKRRRRIGGRGDREEHDEEESKVI